MLSPDDLRIRKKLGQVMDVWEFDSPSNHDRLDRLFRRLLGFEAEILKKNAVSAMGCHEQVAVGTFEPFVRIISCTGFISIHTPPRPPEALA